MKSTNIYHEMTLERCRLHVAQLFAVYYFRDEHERGVSCFPSTQGDFVESILKSLVSDLDLLEREISDSDSGLQE
ncbi:MAG: hypothetical protein H6861_06910 [Rhodospirillales bacterium]|nr:hypothetical protein [Rhodospirillales bacterium]